MPDRESVGTLHGSNNEDGNKRYCKGCEKWVPTTEWPQHRNHHGKVVVYGCPSPGCQFVSESADEMTDHVNEEHQGEWDEDYWPEPEVADDS